MYAAGLGVGKSEQCSNGDARQKQGIQPPERRNCRFSAAPAMAALLRISYMSI
jgi:hypothetical protein